MAEIIKFTDEKFKKLFSLPCDFFGIGTKREWAVYKALEIYEG